MATASNVSFASPLADAKYAQIVGHLQIDGLLGRLAELSGWQIAFTILLVLIAYDQCKLYACQAHHLPPSSLIYRLLPLAERLDCWPSMENSIHWPFPPVDGPEVRGIHGEMGQWASQLRLRFPQVSAVELGCTRASADLHQIRGYRIYPGHVQEGLQFSQLCEALRC